ncbi:hypothetical protein ACFL59_14275 [Planctomycetota bacterium]
MKAQALAVVALATMLTSVSSAQDAADPDRGDLAARRTFFYGLTPGMDRVGVRKAVGEPDSIEDGKLIYRLDQGAVTLTFTGEKLQSCDHRNAGDRGLYDHRIYYSSEGPGPSAEERGRREALLKEAAFRDQRRWGRRSTTTSLHPRGQAYLLHEGYVVLEGIGAYWSDSNALMHLIARATVVARGKSEVRWRLFDHWKEVRPEDLTDIEIARREQVLRDHGMAILGKPIQETLGDPDARMGSGVDYRLYYVTSGLVRVMMGESNTIREIWLKQPGAEIQVGLEEWLKRSD